MVREPRVGRREGRAMPFGGRAIGWSMIVGTLPGDRAHGLPVEAIAGHIRDVAKLAPTAVELAVCMGDTPSHVECEGGLPRVFDGVAGRLVAGGGRVLPLCDLPGGGCGPGRGVPPYASGGRVMT